MKRFYVLMLALLCMAGCSRRPVAEPTPEPTTVPVATPSPAPTPIPSPTSTPEPSYTPGYARLDCGVVWTQLERGKQVTVLGETDEHYALALEAANVFVEKRFVRLDSEAAPEEWTGYAQAAAEIYASPYLAGDVLFTLGMNAPVAVLDSFGDILLVQYEETKGYMEAGSVSLYPIVQYSGGGSGGGGGGQDGGEIVLAFRPQRTPTVMLLNAGAPEYSPMNATGEILADGVEAYLSLFERGDMLRVTEAGEDTCRVWIGEQIGTLPRWMLRMETEAPYEEWDGFTQSNALLYESPTLRGMSEVQGLNAAVRVLEDFGEFYLVQIGDKLGFAAKTQIMKEQAIHYGGGRSSGGGAEWTNPVF